MAMSAAVLSCAATPSQAETGRDTATVVAGAQRALHQTFANLHFEDFGPSPIKGPVYQANAGGRILYFAPESGNLIFAAVYDKDGVNLTALAQDDAVRKRLALIDPAKALAIGPAGAPTVIEFTDPECPYCRALEKFWNAKAAEGKPVRQLVYFVSNIHQGSAAKSEHILCSADKEKAFHALYAGAAPDKLLTCPEGHAKVAADAALTSQIGVSGTPTLIIDGKLVAGFQQGELEQFLDRPKAAVRAQR
ncbi:DsbC family protein [Sphingomonas sp. CGMCC 1.13654]|uniref:Thiol:disulfide interchange protein n=2 Tax=Sphingomonas chungangi TaxID=2683589 RepID=A0A838L6E1_9SPHN|nr:DsbC family protein [Sphingomonas chungangi]MVW57653.1 thioredoxin fold domain-containing protein [Sphingomonas chungangi]